MTPSLAIFLPPSGRSSALLLVIPHNLRNPSLHLGVSAFAIAMDQVNFNKSTKNIPVSDNKQEYRFQFIRSVNKTATNCRWAVMKALKRMKSSDLKIKKELKARAELKASKNTAETEEKSPTTNAPASTTGSVKT